MAETRVTSLTAGHFDAYGSLMSLSAGVKYEDARVYLNLIQKKEMPSDRPIIDSTKFTRLSYFRSIASSTYKKGIIPTRETDINSFLWYYALNVIFKSLPHGFVHFFLAAYAPEEHFFIAKMVPFCHGIKYMFVAVGFFECLMAVDVLVFLLHYATQGLIKKNPWNRCLSKYDYDEANNKTIRCLTLDEFPAMFANVSHPVKGLTYYDEENQEYFQVAQIEYYRQQWKVFGKGWDIGMVVLIWFLMNYISMHVWKRYFWRILNFIQWGICFVDFTSFAYLLLVDYQSVMEETLKYQDNVLEKEPIERTRDDDDREALRGSDVDFLAESITAPPIVHVLASRSTQAIDPSTDSASMIISNAIFYIFKGLLMNKMMMHVQIKLNTAVPPPLFNGHSWLYMCPIFWCEFYLGDIFTIFYILFNVTVVLSTSVVTYQCIVETVVYEWLKLQRWMVALAFFVLGMIMYCTTSIDSHAVLWLYGKSLATLLETVFLYGLYPISRLVDDYYFHYGYAPTQLRILSIRLVPVYYIFKSYKMFRAIWHVLSTTDVGKRVHHYYWSWAVMILPILLGMLYMIYKYLIIYRTTWNFIFRPLAKWGPRDFSVRQLRKQFDSRFYISSEVPRLLSRYLTSKRDTKVYKVDVRYEVQRRSTVSKAVGFGTFTEKRDQGR